MSGPACLTGQGRGGDRGLYCCADGPAPRALEDVDTWNRDQWAASRDDDRVVKLSKKLVTRNAGGRHPKPVVLVRTPGSDKDIIADGHHRFLAAEAKGRADGLGGVHRARERENGPWDTMHNQQQKTTPEAVVAEREQVT